MQEQAFLQKYSSYADSPVMRDLQSFCNDLHAAKEGMVENLLSTLEDRGLNLSELSMIKEEAMLLQNAALQKNNVKSAASPYDEGWAAAASGKKESDNPYSDSKAEVWKRGFDAWQKNPVYSRKIKSATERHMNWDNLMASGADKPLNTLLHIVDDFGVEGIADIDKRISEYAGTPIRDPALRDQFYTNIKIMLKRELANKGLNIEYSDNWSKVVSVNGNPIESSASRRKLNQNKSFDLDNPYLPERDGKVFKLGPLTFQNFDGIWAEVGDVEGSDSMFDPVEIPESNYVPDSKDFFQIMVRTSAYHIEDFLTEEQKSEIRDLAKNYQFYKHDLEPLLSSTSQKIQSSAKRIPVTSAVRPTTTAITKAVAGEIGKDEDSIREFLKDKVSPVSLDKSVALVLKYIPIVEKQSKKVNNPSPKSDVGYFTNDAAGDASYNDWVQKGLAEKYGSYTINLTDTQGNVVREVGTFPTYEKAVQEGKTYLGKNDDGHSWKRVEVEDLSDHSILFTQDYVSTDPNVLKEERFRKAYNLLMNRNPNIAYRIANRIAAKSISEEEIDDLNIDYFYKDRLKSILRSSVNRTSISSAVRPTTVAMTKAVSGEIGDDENSIRLFLQDKVSPAALDRSVALVMKYIPIIRAQQKRQNSAIAGQIATNTNARVLPVGGEVQPSKKSLTGVTYHGWLIDKAVRTPDYYALFVGVNGPFTKTGFTSAQQALDWVINIGDPSTFEGYVDTETINMDSSDITSADYEVSFKDLSKEEKDELIAAFDNGFDPQDLIGYSAAQRDVLRGVKDINTLKRVLSSRVILTQGLAKKKEQPKMTPRQALKKVREKYEGNERDLFEPNRWSRLREILVEELGLDAEHFATMEKALYDKDWDTAIRLVSNVKR